MKDFFHNIQLKFENTNLLSSMCQTWQNGFTMVYNAPRLSLCGDQCSISSGWFGAAFDQNTPAVFTGNRIQTPKLSVSFSHINLASSTRLFSASVVAQRTDQQLSSPQERNQGCRTTTAVSKAVTNQLSCRRAKT